MSADKILSDWKRKLYKPVYWLEGEEEYYIDRLVNFAEHNILPESEAAFNLSVFYGRDASWTDVVNACMRYPMFAEKQVVLLKEAQQLKDIGKLEAYIEKPLASTIFIVAYKTKKVDGRSKLAKLLKERGELFTTKKLFDNQLPEWAGELIQSKGLSVRPKALQMLVEHIGNDLSRINNEVDKLQLNLGSRKTITEDDIEKYVGVSKEYNVFELQNALSRKDMVKAIRIINYFEANPKAGPLQFVMPILYNLFSKTYMLLGMTGADDKTLAQTLSVNPFFLKDYQATARNFGVQGVNNALLLLNHYYLRGVGVGDTGTDDASLLKEMIGKLVNSE